MKLLIFLTLTLLAFSSTATEVLVWDKKPLEIRLEVNKERLIEFPDNISMAIPGKALNRMSVDSAAGVAYLMPRVAFGKVRIKVRLVSTNELILVDLFAVDPSDDMPMQNVKVISNEEKQANEEAQVELMAQSSDVTLKQLVQYVSHDFFAPPEFQKMDLPIQESRILKPLNLELMFTGFSAGIFDLKAIKQYRTQNYTLTAIKVTNRTNETQPIIYSDLENVGYITAGSQHSVVQPKGTQQQSTLLYYITDRPLTENSNYL